MPTQSEIERTLVLLYRSNNAHDYVNYTRPAGWLDKLPLDGLPELIDLLDVLKEEVRAEAKRRLPLTTASVELKECDCCGEMKPDVESVHVAYAGDTSACGDCRNQQG